MKAKKLGLLIILAFACGSLSTQTALGAVRDLGDAGRTFRIAEPDALEEIRAAAAKVDWSKIIDRKKEARAIEHYRPADLARLPAAHRSRTRLVDMTYTLPFDIPDGKGGILYPKGFTFNPLDYVTLTGRLVVIDGADPRQVAWFRKSKYAGDDRTRLILSGGSYFSLSKALARPVFYLSSEMADRLSLAAVPSVIRQRGRVMEVVEIPVPGKGKRGGKP